MEQWSSRLGFIFAAIGAAVGLGNIWRFPAVVGENGGGAYLVPYLIAACAFAIPLLILEISVGRSLKADIVSACQQVRAELEIVGWLIAGSVLAVLSYYLVITGWVLAYFLFTLTGAEFTFSEFTDSYWPLVFYTVSTLIVGSVVSLGVQRGIERMATILIPFIFVTLGILLLYIATLDGFMDGLWFFFSPDTAVLDDPMIWSAAFGQVFFSFSVGMGVMLTYGSYLQSDAKISRSAVTIAAADLAVAFLAGMIIFGIVFSVGLEPSSGTELAFTTLPAGFEAMPFGSVVGIAFFGLLFVAAITPSVSMLEVGVAGVKRTTDWSRTRSSLVMTGLIFLAGLPSALSYSAVGFAPFGRPFLDDLDATVGTLGLPIAAVAIVGIFAWLQEGTTFREQVPNDVVRVLVKYVVPVVLLVVTAVRVWREVRFTSWRRVPDLAGISPRTQILVIGLFVGGLLLGGILIHRIDRRET